MKRLVYSLVATLSAVVFAMAGGLSLAHSAGYPAAVLWGVVNGVAQQRRGISSGRAGVSLHVFRVGPPPGVNLSQTGVDVTAEGYSALYPGWVPNWEKGGGSVLGFSEGRRAWISFSSEDRPGQCVGRDYVWTVPYWFILSATAPAPIAWVVIAFRRRNRLTEAGNHCKHCGYDLRATVGRCPECGMLSSEE